MTNLPGVNLLFHSIRPQGGMDRHVLDLIAGFSARGIALRVIARVVDWKDKPESNVEYIVLPDRTPFSRFNNDRFEQRALEYVRADWPVIGVSRVPGKVDLAISGGTHRTHLRDKGKNPGFFDRRVIAHEQSLYSGAGIVIAHSKRVRNEIIEQYQIDPAKVIALYPSVDTSVFNLAAREKREEIRNELGINKDQFLLLFPSNDHLRKGASLILESMKGLGGRMILAVAGKESLKGEHVINLGFREDIPALYAAADATILASVYEPFGLVGPESILCGTPVLLADTIGAIEVLSEPGCYRFKRDAAELRLLLQNMLIRFDEKSLAVTAPEETIHYPYTFDAYLDELIGFLKV